MSSKAGKGGAGPRGGVKNANRRLGDRLWDGGGVEFTKCSDPAGYYADPARAARWVLQDALAVGLLLDHSALRWLSRCEAVGAVAELLRGSGDLCENPLGASRWQQVGGTRHVVVLEEDH